MDTGYRGDAIMNVSVISLLINSYLTLLISVGIGSLLMFLLGLYWILKQAAPRKQKTVRRPTLVMAPQASHDFTAIAGDDVVATQLDLARAYIETGKKSLAEEILNHVVTQGNAIQQAEAERLLNR